MQPSSPESFDSVFAAELEEIAKRQGKTSSDEVDRKELAGLALSGGGIRSATTSLGALQALKKLGLLHVFDYLSTVSGGGFTGSWWSAWASRDFDPQTKPEEKFFPPPELTQPERDLLQLEKSPIGNDAKAEDRSPWKLLDPVHHLRLFGNYLTPMKGALSSDTWRAATVISRNLLLTWLVLLPMLFAAVLLSQAYFTTQPHAETEFLYPYSHTAADSALLRQITLAAAFTYRLDSLVHGAQQVEQLPILKDLRDWANEPAYRQDHENTVLLRRLIGELDFLERGYTPLLADSESLPTLTPVVGELGRLHDSLVLWSSADSAIEALQNTNIFGVPVAAPSSLHATNQYFATHLDPVVDSTRVDIAQLERELLSHRSNTKDNLLFTKVHLTYLANRAVWASHLPVMMLAWIVMLICLWMINSGNRLFGGNLIQGSYSFIAGLIAYNLLNLVVHALFGGSDMFQQSQFAEGPLELIWAIVALALLNRLLWDDAHSFWRATRKSPTDADQKELLKLLEVRRSRIVTMHQRLLLAAVVTTLLLAFGGFGHEAINYLFFYHAGSHLSFLQDFGRSTGILAILAAIVGSALAARRAAPTERGEPKQANKFKDILVNLAPSLILLLLLCGVSWASHWLLQDLTFLQGKGGGESGGHQFVLVIFSLWLFGFLSLYYAVYDLRFRGLHTPAAMVAARHPGRYLLSALVVLQVAILIASYVQTKQIQFTHFPLAAIPAAVTLIVWIVVAWKYKQELASYQARESEPGKPADTKAGEVPGIRPAGVRDRIVSAGATLLIFGFSGMVLLLAVAFVDTAQLPIDDLFMMALGASVLLFLVDLIWGIRRPVRGSRGNHEARLLLAINITIWSVYLMTPPLKFDPHWGVTHILEILIGIAIGLVIFVGWRVDPNALSIHAFYKQRIARAYLGASNARRKFTSMSEVDPEDDLMLTQLKNCEHGAPYHLINTTLNLLGTKSLEAAQRKASNFILSKRYCGSVTTGYRATDEYMSGTMTLGTAVAISGAAASPNMGSNQVSGATTMLMSLLNVRLGYWAANPRERRWRESQPMLWPYYLLRESLSQTTGFGTFCYLTDGGHFDNTGLYPLIERACRYIVLCDNGADPEAHFKDLGNALRRARIDFGVEFDLSGLKEMTSMTRRRSGYHWLRGTVRYSEEHVRLVWGEAWDEGLSEADRERCLTGTILILKPALVGDEPADVLQYGLQYPEFPQQSTANQWFSEDQFESYRRLGYWSVQTAFGKPDYSTASRADKLEAIAEWPAEMAADSIPAMNDLAYGASLEDVQSPVGTG